MSAPRHNARIAALSLSLALSSSACVDEATQVIVSVDAEAGLRADIDKLRIRVQGRDGVDSEAQVEKLDQTLDGEIAWPVKLAFKPAEDDPDRVFWLEVVASDGATALATARLVTGYVDGETRYAALLLEDDCRGVECVDTESTCHSGGCVPAYLDPTKLGDSLGKAVGVGALSDGGLPVDGGGVPDEDSGPRDAGQDAGQDAGGNDAGHDSGPPLDCTVHTECTEADEPICDPAGSCRGCTGDPECQTLNAATPHCVGGSCVQCTAPRDCDAASPVCEMGSCRTCALNNECATGACGASGACTPTTDIVYFDPSNGSSSASCGVQGMPCVYVSDVMALLSPTRNVLHITAGTHTQLQLDFNTTAQVRVVGVGATANLLNSSGGPGIRASGGARLTIEDLTIQNAKDETFSPYTPGDAVVCTGSTLVLNRVTLKNNASYGVSATTCTLEVNDSLIEGNGQYGIRTGSGSGTVQRSIIRDNLRGGISVGNPSPLRIVNNLIVGNSNLSNYDGAIRGSSSGTDTVIAFNTITGNFVNQNYIGILGCSVDWVVDSNIVWGNSVGSNDLSQTYINCTVSNSLSESAASVTGINGSNFSNMISTEPKWTNPGAGSYGLQSDSPALNIGTASHAGELDQARNPRIVGSGPDLGCYER